MSLEGKQLQIVDTNDVLLIDKTSGKTMFSGFTSAASLDQKVTSIPISGGIGDKLRATLRSKKIITAKISISQFDLDFIASMNGVAVDRTAPNSYFIGQSVAVTTNTATVTGAIRILSVQTVKGSFLTIVTTDPIDATQVKVSGTSLTFHTSFTDVSVLVSYIGSAAVGKDNYTITFNAESFSRNAEMLYKTRAYDTEAESPVAQVVSHFYKVNLDGAFTLNFAASKQTPTDVNIDILVPDYLPDGTINTAGDIGVMTITEL